MAVAERSSAPAAPPSSGGRGPFLLQATATVFAASFATMALEIAAGRVLAPRLGVSLYTWTSTLGVVLLGMSLGNYLGGRLADRRAQPADSRAVGRSPATRIRTALGTTLAAAAATTWLSLVVAAAYLQRGVFDEAPLVARVVILNGLMLFAPSLFLGTVTPLCVRLCVVDLRTTGATVGTLYAWSTMGAIAGTLVTGFVLIETFGTRMLVTGVAAGLTCLAIVAGRLWAAERHLIALLGTATLLVGTTIGFREVLLRPPCLEETSYFCIQVLPIEERPGGTTYAFVLDHLFHSRITPAEPTRLEFGYIRTYADVTAIVAQRRSAMRVLMIGGGGYALPRYLEVIYPSADLHVLEIDPRVLEANHTYLDLPRETRIRTHVGDARALLLAWPERRAFDLVFGDAFNDLSVPYHLTTLEFVRMVDSLLADDGVYLVNVIDHYQTGELLRAFLNTFGEVFPHVYLIRSGDPRPDRLETLVVAGSRQPLDAGPFDDPLAHQERLGRLVSGRIVDPAEVEAYRRTGRHLVLTDDYVPVDQLTAPLFVLGKR